MGGAVIDKETTGSNFHVESSTKITPTLNDKDHKYRGQEDTRPIED